MSICTKWIPSVEAKPWYPRGIAAADNGYILLGKMKIGANSDLSARVERIDELGNTLWEQDFPGIYSAENERAESFDEYPIQFNRCTKP
jgi:hypothetical protein